MNKEEKEKKKSAAREAQRVFFRKKKVEAIEAYGGACACGESRIACLTVIAKESVYYKKRTDAAKLYIELARRGYPNGYEIMCRNCRALKGGEQV
ncbi:MAG: hypothetical protein WC530_09590 [Candidatus Omnitrophota bacterium]|jgi:hypothetical protein